jgi:hypothetical protein
MNWRYETWRRLYVREEGSFAALSYSAKALAAMLLKHCDDRGRIYARAGEPILDGLCARLGANRGERRTIRKAFGHLLKDGYLVEAGPGCLRIRNFTRAHGGVDGDTPPLETTPEQRPSSEPVTTVSPSSTDAAPTVSRPCLEPVATVSRPCTEECVNGPESLGTPADVPSVPFLPSRPSFQGEGELPPVSGTEQAARARAGVVPLPAGPSFQAEAELTVAGLEDPDPPHWATDTVGGLDPIRSARRSPPAPGWTAQRILDAWGRIREEVVPGALAWHAAGRALYAKAGQLAEAVADDPAAQADIEPTMRLSIERALDSQDPRDSELNWGFSVWLSRFTDLREELRGRRLAPGTPNKPCDFHAGGRNTGRKAAKHEFRRACPECRHLDARAGPRPASPPESTAEVLGGTTGG